MPSRSTPSRRLFLGMTAAALALTACAPGGPPAPLQTEVAARFATQSPARQAGAHLWWAAFRDPRLDGFVSAGLARNLDVLTAVEVIREAQATARGVGANDLPTVNAEASSTRGDQGLGVSTQNQGALGVSWAIDLFGANRQARRGAEARLDAAYLSAEVARLTVASAVAQAYIDARYYQEAIALTQRSLSSRRKTLELTRAQDEAGTVSRVEVLQAEQLVAQAEASLPSLEVGRDQAINRLATLTASTSAHVAAQLKSGTQPRARYAASVGVPADVVRARPDVQVSERQFAAAMADVGQARAAFYPQLSLGGSITTNGTTSWSFGPQLSIPLFNAANTANLSGAQARAEQARLAWRGSVLNAVEEVENALSGYTRDSRAVAAQAKLVANATESVDLTRSSFELGESDFFPVLDAERNLLEARQQHASALRQQALNFVALSVASSGGVGLTAPK